MKTQKFQPHKVKRMIDTLGVMYQFNRDKLNKYKESTASKVSGTVNNSYLQSQGESAGLRSYGMVVDLAVAYFRANPSGG